MMLHWKFLTVLIVISVFMLFSAASSSQGATELEFILACNPIQDASVDHRSGSSAFSDAGGVKLLFVGALRFYQRFISTQDGPACNFTPSCSQFGVESFRNFDFVRAILLTSDRLQRCNSMSNSPYEADHRSGRLKDPIQTYCELLK